MNIKRLDVYYINFGEQGIKPCVILTNDVANRHSPVLHVAYISTKLREKNNPTNVFIDKNIAGLRQGSYVLISNTRLINKDQISDYVTTLKPMENEINKAIKTHFGLD